MGRREEADLVACPGRCQKKADLYVIASKEWLLWRSQNPNAAASFFFIRLLFSLEPWIYERTRPSVCPFIRPFIFQFLPLFSVLVQSEFIVLRINIYAFPIFRSCLYQYWRTMCCGSASVQQRNGLIQTQNHTKAKMNQVGRETNCAEKWDIRVITSSKSHWCRISI